MRNASRLFGFALLAAATLSCGDVARQGSSPVYLTLDSLKGASGGGAATFSNVLFSNVLKFTTTPAPCSVAAPCATVFADLGQAVFRVVPKDVVGLASPTTNNEVTLTGYHVSFRRTDGRNTQGVDVPFAFDGAATGLIAPGPGGSINFELVRVVAKGESPLVQLIISQTVITTLADVTFYGKDRVGNDISVTGTIQIDFGKFADT